MTLMAKQPHNDEFISQRRFPRRDRDVCICTIDHQPYPVDDWSLGGISLRAPGKRFAVGQEIDITLKFRIDFSILDIAIRARVVRKSRYKVALTFDKMTPIARRKFELVIKSIARS